MKQVTSLPFPWRRELITAVCKLALRNFLKLSTSSALSARLPNPACILSNHYNFNLPRGVLEGLFPRPQAAKLNISPTLQYSFNQNSHHPYDNISSMSSNSGGIGLTLIGGIQSVAAILPLLFTQQCADHVSSALTRGYLYAAASPLSIFGSLGVAIMGLKTLIACFSFGDIEGAKILGKMGFEPQGENLSLIMVEAGKGGRYIIETRMDDLIKDLYIDKNRIIGVSHKSDAWNVKMMTTTALLCAFSIAPYIYLNQGVDNLEESTTWVLFPVLRSTGGFITAILIQLLIQRRITTLSNQYLQVVKRDQQRNVDVEAAGDTKKMVTITWSIATTWLLLCVLLISLAASVVGYMGCCFSIVKNSASTIGPVGWLCLEAGLSVVRLVICGWNPTRDDSPPLEIILELDTYEHNPLLTCSKDDEEILQHKVLPLTPSQDFMKIITSFAGLIEPFNNPDLSLFYTLTRNRLSEKSVKSGEWNLYITVFDLKEHTTRVYTRDNERDIFYSTKTDSRLINVKLDVEINAQMNPKGDPVFTDNNNLKSLRKHHQSILESIHYRLDGQGDVSKPYAIENNWTMKVEDTIIGRTLQRLREENGDAPYHGYFVHPSIERERRLLDEKHVEWVTSGMEMITKETKERFQGKSEVEYQILQGRDASSKGFRY